MPKVKIIPRSLFFHRWSRVCEGLFATTGCVGKLRGTLSIHNLAHDQACVPFAFNQCLSPVKSTKKGIQTPETRPSRPLQLGPSQVCHVPVIQHNVSLPKKKRLGCTCMSQNKTEGPNIVEKRVWDEEAGKSERTVVCLILFTINNSFYQLGVNWGMLTGVWNGIHLMFWTLTLHWRKYKLSLSW